MTIVKFFMSDLHACGHIRGEVVAREINRQFPNVLMDCKSDVLFSDSIRSNILIFQRAFRDDLLASAMAAKKRGIKIVYEIDDDLFNLPKDFEKPYDFYGKPEIRQALTSFIQASDAVIVSTYELAVSLNAVSPGNPKFVIENALDVDQWEHAYQERQTAKRDSVTIGWMASGSHVIDTPLVADAIWRIMEEFPNVRLHLIGWVESKHFGETRMLKFADRMEIQPWLPITVIPKAMSDFDIGLCPIVDNAFNRCKSNIKYLSHAALGVPSVVSPLPPYKCVRHGEDGLVAADNSPESWYDCLKQLVSNEVLRVGLGAMARKKLLKEYDIRRTAVQWTDAFQKILAS